MSILSCSTYLFSLKPSPFISYTKSILSYITYINQVFIMYKNRQIIICANIPYHKLFSAHISISLIDFSSSFPFLVSSYSTFTGILVYTFLFTSWSCSSSFSLSARTLSLSSGIFLLISVNLIGSSNKVYNTSPDHFFPRISKALCIFINTTFLPPLNHIAYIIFYSFVPKM